MRWTASGTCCLIISKQSLFGFVQDLEDIKRAMQSVAEDSSLRPDEADRKRQLLLNQFYGASGDAKAAPAAEHVNMLLDKGGFRVLRQAVMQSSLA